MPTDPRLSPAATRRLQQTAFRAARKLTRHEDLAQEAANLAVARLNTSLGQLAQGERVWASWVRTVARNHVLAVGERWDREPALGPGEADAGEDSDDAAAAGEVAFAEAIADAYHRSRISSLVARQQDFRRKWRKVSPECRELLELKYVEGYKSQAIAEQLGFTEAEVNNKLARARAAARPILQELHDGRP